ncbi:MoaD/ThiS family protein [Sinomonas sp. JGH33]|uniref:Molybdopterin synthase sulfur carrier subunit n=1 Tax=Sinomonas terricola TaxID=3110330 RepID=A0ABU5T4J7_9MICC|nr:MoaD/ThiS family protein [Sinomonas sp. JGH33]MEA5454570.1 MoaD/ThiS family protein [Sinomonas sp. JGH33]
MVITVRYYAAARAAAGVESEHLELPDGATLALALKAASAVVRVPEPGAPELGDVLRRCSFLVNEIAAKDSERTLEDGDTVDVLPPFAGG